MRLAAVAPLLVLLVLGGCSGGSADPDATTSTTPVVPAAGQPTNPPPTGTPVPEALSRFRCAADKTGLYAASGVLANTTKAAVTFQVTVYVGQPGAAPQPAKTARLAQVAGGGSVKFALDQIPVGSEGGSCFVQVVTTK